MTDLSWFGRIKLGIRLLLAIVRHWRSHPLSSTALWASLRRIPWTISLRKRTASYLVITHQQVDRFLRRGWDYTERRLELLVQVSNFPIAPRGVQELVDLRQRMELTRDDSFDVVARSIYEDPMYPNFQHVGQAFRNQVTGRQPFVSGILSAMPQPVRCLLDAGCGSGILMGDVLEQCLEARGFGVDVSQTVLNHARLVHDARGLSACATLVRADLRLLPFLNGKFDFIMAMEVLEHLPDPAAGLRELVRVLAPDGWLLSSIPVQDPAPVHLHVFTSVEEVTRLHVEAGLEVKRQLVEEVSPGVPDVITAARIAKDRGL